MNIDLTEQDLEVIRTSLNYSKERITNEDGTPYALRQEKLKCIEVVLLKLSQSNE